MNDRSFNPFEIARQPEGLPPDMLDNAAAYDKDIPLWRKTVALVRQYSTVKPQGRQALIDQFSEPIANNFSQLPNIFSNLDMIIQLNPNLNVEDVRLQLIKSLETKVSKSNSSAWTPERIEDLIRLSIDTSDLTKTAMNGFVRALFRSPQSVAQSIDLHYNTAWAMVTTEREDIREELFYGLCFERDFLSENSESTMYFEAGIYASDDPHLGKYHATYDALLRTNILISLYKHGSVPIKGFEEGDITKNYDVVNSRTERLQAAQGDPRYPLRGRVFNAEALKNIVRTEKLQDMQPYPPAICWQRVQKIQQIAQEQRVPRYEATRLYYEEIKQSPWPMNVMQNPDDPLRNYLNLKFDKFYADQLWEKIKTRLVGEGYDHVTDNPIELATDGVEMDIWARNCKSHEQKLAIMKLAQDHFWASGRNELEGQGTGEPLPPPEELAKWLTFATISSIDEDRNIIYAIKAKVDKNKNGILSSLVEHRRPLITQEQYLQTLDQLTQIRSDLQNKFTRSAGKRGYEILVCDPALLRLGYEAFEFRQNKNTTSASIIIENTIYEFQLDSQYRIMFGENIKGFSSPQDRAWLEILTLSHLKKVMCTSEEELPGELLGGQKQYENYRKQIVQKIEHLRRLHPGQNFSQEAFSNCLESDLPLKNLYQINRMRAEVNFGGTRETGIWTYVSGVERDIDTQAAYPVLVSYKNASDDIRKAIPLGDVSPEELSRIEGEILEEMQVK